MRGNAEPDSTALADGGLSFVIPAFNEAAGIEDTCRAVVRAGRDLVTAGAVAEWELVVVDDASTDATGEICDRLASEQSRLVSVRRPVNGSLGAAVRSGLERARGRLVFYTDADQPFDLDATGTALGLMRSEGADIVSAYRRSRGGEGPRRWMYSYAYNALVRAVFDVRVKDVNFAAKLLDRRVIDALELTSQSSFIDAEILVRADRLGFRVAQFATDYRPRSRGVSTLSSPRVVATMIREMVTSTPELGTRWTRGKLR